MKKPYNSELFVLETSNTKNLRTKKRKQRIKTWIFSPSESRILFSAFFLNDSGTHADPIHMLEAHFSEELHMHPQIQSRASYLGTSLVLHS